MNRNRFSEIRDGGYAASRRLRLPSEFSAQDLEMLKQADQAVDAIEHFFTENPPTIGNETLFLIKQLFPDVLAKRVAAYASEDAARITVEFR